MVIKSKLVKKIIYFLKISDRLRKYNKNVQYIKKIEMLIMGRKNSSSFTYILNIIP